jgi:hypothetical protein
MTFTEMMRKEIQTPLLIGSKASLDGVTSTTFGMLDTITLECGEFSSLHRTSFGKSRISSIPQHQSRDT